MRPPSRVTTVVVLGGLVLVGVAMVGAATTGASSVEQTNSGPVIVENGSTYDVSETLQFDVNSSNDTYEIRTESRAFVDMVTAEDGIVTLDTTGMNGGTYVLVNHDTGAVEYEFTLRRTEITTTSSSTTDEDATDVTNRSSSTQSRTTDANQDDGYPGVPGFGFETAILAFVAGGIVLVRRYQ